MVRKWLLRWRSDVHPEAKYKTLNYKSVFATFDFHRYDESLIRNPSCDITRQQHIRVPHIYSSYRTGTETAFCNQPEPCPNPPTPHTYSC